VSPDCSNVFYYFDCDYLIVSLTLAPNAGLKRRQWLWRHSLAAKIALAAEFVSSSAAKSGGMAANLAASMALAAKLTAAMALVAGQQSGCKDNLSARAGLR